MIPLYIGIDPSVTRPALAAMNPSFAVEWLGLVRRGSKSRGLAGVNEVMAMIRRFEIPTSVAKRIRGVIVEGQEYRRVGKRRSRPADLVNLAHISGAFASLPAFAKARVEIATPSQWKKGVPKRVHQARVLGRLGIGYTAHGTPENGYCEPAFPQKKLPTLKQADGITCLVDRGKPQPNAGDWKELSDAIGLAEYAVKELA